MHVTSDEGGGDGGGRGWCSLLPTCFRSCVNIQVLRARRAADESLKWTSLAQLPDRVWKRALPKVFFQPLEGVGEILDGIQKSLLLFYEQLGLRSSTLIFMCNRYLICKAVLFVCLFFCFLMNVSRAWIRVHCVGSVWPLLKHDNSGGERAASHHPFLAAVTEQTNASFTNLHCRRGSEHNYYNYSLKLWSTGLIYVQQSFLNCSFNYHIFTENCMQKNHEK